ncbi:MAG: carboxypeptidase-like regulatory domain-containing protein [Acidobacteriota bacterium]|nr:carboxypeptidase-like regulatory domain-containing protein [Acidobacteriota bacterium]
MKRLFPIAITMLVSAVLVIAQTTTGRLSGVVSSPDGVLPGATVTATDNNTGRTQTVTTGEDGAFLFPQLEFGTYTVTITSTGFKTFSATEVKIDVGREYTLNPTLELGNVQETVTVTAGADVVTATSAQVSNTVSPQQILSLPLLARDPLGLTTLQPGVQSNSAQETAINGMRTSFTNITRDGINIQDNYIRQNATDFAPGRPSVDDTAEFTITTANQEADQGYGGAQIRLVTPRGTRDFHGALFAYNRNSAFAANSFFNNRTGTARPFRNRNQFGGKLGGPLPFPGFGDGGPLFYKDKGFFFVAYEKIIDPLSNATTRTILTPSARSGVFTYNRTNAGAPINTPFVSCPSGAAGSVCTANILGLANSLGFANTPTTINPVIQNRILSQMPEQGNFTGGDQINTTGFRFNRQANVERTTFTTRLDFDINDNNSVNGVYSWNLEQTLRNDMDPTGFTVTPRGDVASRAKMLALAYRRTFSPTFVNELRGGFFFQSVLFGTYENPNIALGLPLISNPENNNGPQGRYVKNYNLQDNVDWIIGDHSVRFGGQLQYFNPKPFDTFGILPTATIGTSSATPFFACSSAATCQLPGGISQAQLGTANSLLALLAGYVTGYQQTFNLTSLSEGFAASPNVTPFAYSNHSLYVADRWSVNNSLTLTAGVRYELFPAMKQTNGVALEPVIPEGTDPRQALLDRNGASNVVGGNAGTTNAFYKTDFNNFAPQIGFAYAPKFENGFARALLGETFVIRGGYSHIYGNDQIVTAILQAPANIAGLGQRTAFGSINNSTQLNLRLGDSLPALTTPTLTPTPPYSFIRNNTPGIGGNFVNGTVFGVDPDLKTPMYQQYSFGVQREFFGNMALEVRYVGTRSNNLLRAYNLNQVDIISNGILADFNRALNNLSLPGATTAFCNPATVAGCQALQIFQNGAVAGVNPGPGRITIGGANGLNVNTFNTLVRNGTPGDLVNNIFQLGFNNHPTLTNPNAVPFINILPNPAAGTIAFLTNDAKSRYDSLQMELRRRFANGLYFQANYTFSETTTNAVGGDQFYFEPYLNNAQPELNNQRADFDLTHVFNFNGVYQLPFGKNRTFLNQGGIVDKIFGGWEISGILQWTSGTPISIVDPRGTFNTAARSARQPAMSSLSAQQIGALGGVYEANGRIYFIDPSVIAPTGAATLGFRQPTFDGQVFFNNDPGQTGNIPLTVINGPRYFNVNAALLKNIAFSERMRLQLRAEAFNVFNNVNFTVSAAQQVQSINATTFGQLTTAGSPRILQFAARFEF